MNTTKLLRIEKRPPAHWFIFWILALPLLWGIVFEGLGLPSMVKYTADVAWVILLGLMIFKPRIVMPKKIIPFVILVICFFLYCLIAYLFNYQSVIYFLWGMRNNFRFYVLFFAVIMFFREIDADKTFEIFDILFWINFSIVLIQYFVLEYKQDYLGGIFGTVTGVNATTIIFMSIVVSRSLLKYMEKSEKLLLCTAKCAASLVIAILAELKFYFVFFIIMLIVSVLMTSFSWRKLFVLIFGAIGAYFAGLLLIELFGFEGFMSIENIWQLATQDHYSSEDTVNRLSAIPSLIRILEPDAGTQLFGMGLGNCDTSAFAICNTTFYQIYGYLRYTFFSCAFLFLEVGYVGLFIYAAFFVLCAALTYKRIKSGRCNTLHGRVALITVILALTLIVYNASLRAEAGYIVYFVLALPFIDRNSDADGEVVFRNQED